MKYLSTLINVFRAQNFKNAFWNLFSTAAYPVLMLLATPYFIHKLGAAQFGIWMLVNSISQTMNIFNMGLGDANIRYISKYKALEDHNEIKRIVSTTTGIGLIIAAVGILAGFVIAFFIQNDNWFNISESNADLAAVSIQLALILFSIKFLEIIALSIFQGFERYDLQARYSLLTKVLILVGNIMVVILDGSLISILLASVTIQLGMLLLEVLVIKKRYSFISFKPSYQWEAIKKVFDFSIWTWLQSVLAILSSQIDKFIVAYFSGVQVLSYYSLGYLLMTQVHAVYSAAVSWIFPVVSKKSAKGESLDTIFSTSQGVLLVFGFGSLITFLILERPLMVLWLGEETYALSATYIHLFLYYNIFLLLNIMPFYFLNGSGFVKYNTYSEFITRLLNLGGMVGLYAVFGNTGLIWGHIVSMLIATPIKMSLVRTHVLQHKNRILGLDSIICGVLIIVGFELNPLWMKFMAVIIFCSVFYLLYLRHTNLLLHLTHAFKGKSASH